MGHRNGRCCVLQTFLLTEPLQNILDRLGVNRLDNIFPDAQGNGGLGKSKIRIGTDDYKIHRVIRHPFVDGPNQGQTVHHRHPDIGKYQVRAQTLNVV